MNNDSLRDDNRSISSQGISDAVAIEIIHAIRDVLIDLVRVLVATKTPTKQE